MDIVQPAVEAVAVARALRRAVVPQLAHDARRSSALFVTTAPPSPNVPRFFWMMKLVHAASLSSPILNRRPGADRLRVVFDHEQLVLVRDLAIAFMSAHWP